MLLFGYLYVFTLALAVHASLYVINPLPTSSCRASHPCTVEWLDDGTVPLLSDIGVSTVGLYMGEEKLAQTIAPVDVNSVHSLTFIPDPKAGPNSNKYYIVFTSTNLNATNGTGHYQAFSSNFRLTQMTGSSKSRPASDTSTKPIPSSLLTQTATQTGAQSTVTVGTLSTSSFSVSTLPATGSSSSLSSGAALSIVTSPLASASSTGVSGGTQANGASSTVWPPVMLMFLPLVLLSLF